VQGETLDAFFPKRGKAGDDLLRQVLVQAAHRLTRYDTHWKSMATRLRAKGKKTCVIVAAVANRWVRKLFHSMRESTSIGEADVGFLRHGQQSVPLESSSDAGLCE
jgi:hypothetical protein